MGPIIIGALAIAAWVATEPAATPVRAVRNWMGGSTSYNWAPFTDEVRARVVGVTTAQESGGKFWAVNPNSERFKDPKNAPGVSWGILQWTQKSGNLGIVLDACRAADKPTFDATVAPFSADELVRVCRAGSLGTVNGKVLWDAAWVKVFQALGRVPIFQQVQTWFAANGSHMKAAVKTCIMLGLESEKGLALAFDRATQQGEGWIVKAATSIAANWKSTGRTPDYEGRLKALADSASARANGNPWEDDVNRRIKSVLARTDLSDTSVRAA